MKNKNRSNYDSIDFDISRKHDIQQEKFLKRCAYLASKSALTQKHGCVIVRRNEIISCGYNFKIKDRKYISAKERGSTTSSYISPVHFNDTSNTDHYGCGFSVHAEISTIKKVKNMDLSNCEMYVVRLGPYSNLKYSHPCKICSEYIEKFRIKKVYYSVNCEFVC